MLLRAAAAAWLLVRVYQGSRFALVVALALLFVDLEIHALIIWWDRR